MQQSLQETLRATDRKHANELKVKTAVAHLRATARDIAHALFGVNIETAEVVVMQDQFEKVLYGFVNSQDSASSAATYVSPDQTRARITAASVAAGDDAKEH